MQIGVVYPHTELPNDPGTLRAYAQGVEELGFEHLLTHDHILGADPAIYPGWDGPYDVDSTFREPLVFFGYLAALTRLELVTGILIAPQRQTALLAKQAAEVDLLTEGRFRLGIGVGWNEVEYVALGEDFKTRGQREEEQITLLRRLWTERTVTFEGRFDQITGAGIAPLPVQRPIPIWLGGASDAAYRRIGRIADGWFPQVSPGPKLDAAQELIREAARQAGRDTSSIGMEPRLRVHLDRLEELVETARVWQREGATHASLNTADSGLTGVDAHLGVLARAASALRPLS